jgi:aspartate 4-decarboxylase
MSPFMWTVKTLVSTPNKFIHQLVDSIIGDHYPVPDRMLVHNEQIVHEYLEWAMCGEPHTEGQVQDLRGRGRHRRHVLHLQVAEEQPHPESRATPSRSACRSSRRTSRWRTSRLRPPLRRGAREAGITSFQYPDEELEKLLDPKIKAFFVVNPGNPVAGGAVSATIDKIRRRC